MRGPLGDRWFETLRLVAPQNDVLRIEMNRPQVRNALNTQMGRDLIAVFEDIALDPRWVRCLVFTGVGDQAFCAGGDLKERRGMSDGAWQSQHAIFERMARALIDCPVPLIAAESRIEQAGLVAGGARYRYSPKILKLSRPVSSRTASSFSRRRTGAGCRSDQTAQMEPIPSRPRPQAPGTQAQQRRMDLGAEDRHGSRPAHAHGKDGVGKPQGHRLRPGLPVNRSIGSFRGDERGRAIGARQLRDGGDQAIGVGERAEPDQIDNRPTRTI